VKHIKEGLVANISFGLGENVNTMKKNGGILVHTFC
jgi:hypothetical protein